jgi:CheY-like chemotaxis protein
MNLITNASEAIGSSSGLITISTDVLDCGDHDLSQTLLDEKLQPGKYVYLEVTDTGCGMDKETQSKIFDPFYTTKFTGRGLGLAAVLGIVRGHKAAITVQSEKGRGTTFKLLFPASDKIQVRTAKEPPRFENFQSEESILVIDDEENIREAVREILEMAGLHIFTAPDGQTGLELFKKIKNQLSLVILDLTMPYMSGEDVFEQMRQIKPEVPVLLTSGYSEQEIAPRFAGKGLAGFIKKPFNPIHLVNTVKQMLEQKG